LLEEDNFINLYELQNSIQEMLRFGFTDLARQNSQLLANNEKLSDQLIDLQNKFEIVLEVRCFRTTFLIVLEK
jgi:hypothetical protein